MVKAKDQMLKIIDEYMDDFINSVFAKSQNNLVDDNKIDTGTLFKTANVNREFLSKEIVYPASYAESVEFGRNPGSMPPVDPLVKWVRRKLGVRNLQEAQSIAWAISKSIKKRGIAPVRFLRNAIEATEAEFELR